MIALGEVLRGFLIPIINTTFIELSTAAYLRNSVFPRLILRLNLLTCIEELSGQPLTKLLYWRPSQKLSHSGEQPIVGIFFRW